MKRAVVFAPVVLLAASAFGAGTNMTGQWTIHQNIANNESDQECTFVQTDNNITGTCKSMEGKDLAVTGSVDGSKVSWKFDSEYNGTPLTLVYTATVDDSGKVAGNVDVQPFNVSGDFTAVPSKDPAK